MTSAAPTQPHSTRPDSEIDAVQERYATRIKSRLAAPKIDMVAARDGMLDCFVSTYFGGLKAGIGGTLGINASEDHVARIAQALFKKKLVKHGASFEAPTVEALDRVKAEVDEELHFHELPAEISGVHDQVCSLLLSKAEGTLDHKGARSVAQAPKAPAIPASPRPTIETTNLNADASDSVVAGLRQALIQYLQGFRNAAAAGEDIASLRARVEKTSQLIDTLADFSDH